MTNRKHHVKDYFWGQWFLYSDISYPNDFGSIK